MSSALCDSENLIQYSLSSPSTPVIQVNAHAAKFQKILPTKMPSLSKHTVFKSFVLACRPVVAEESSSESASGTALSFRGFVLDGAEDGVSTSSRRRLLSFLRIKVSEGLSCPPSDSLSLERALSCLFLPEVLPYEPYRRSQLDRRATRT